MSPTNYGGWLMSRILTVRPLHPKRVTHCYPLALIALPGCTPDAWEAYARRHIELRGGPPTGIFVSEDNLGTILGLLVYQITGLDTLKKSFQAKTLMAADAFSTGREKVAESLVAAEEEAAHATGCSLAEVFPPVERGPRETQWWIALLEARGYRQLGQRLTKPLTDVGGLLDPSLA